MVPSGETSVPASVPGLQWTPLRSALGVPADPSKLTITAGSDGRSVPFTATAQAGGTYVLVPAEPLVVGERYTVTDATSCEGAPPLGVRSTFEVTPAVALPATLGSLTATELEVAEVPVDTSSGSCTIDVIAAQRTVVLTLDPAIEAWADLLQYEAFVDGKPWNAEPMNDRFLPKPRPPGNHVLVYRTCSRPDGATIYTLAAGWHDVEVRATLPGSSRVVASETLRIDLACPGDPGAWPGEGDEDDIDEDAGCSAAGAASSTWLGLVLGALLVGRARRRAARAR